VDITNFVSVISSGKEKKSTLYSYNIEEMKLGKYFCILLFLSSFFPIVGINDPEVKLKEQENAKESLAEEESTAPPETGDMGYTNHTAREQSAIYW